MLYNLHFVVAIAVAIAVEQYAIVNVSKPEPGSTFPTLWPPSRKFDMTSTLRRRWSDYCEIWQADVK